MLQQQVVAGIRAGFGRFGQGSGDSHKMDRSETIYISSLALIKMLKHGRAGVPIEVMGLMLGEIVDDFTINVVDVFAMPQFGTGVSIEAVDPVYQVKMLDMLKQTGRAEMVVGWYHSHPGFGCWLSNVDVKTQRFFEDLQDRAVAVVIDPVQSVRGKVVIDAFRTFPIANLITARMGGEPRQTTSNVGELRELTVTRMNAKAVQNGLGVRYYSIQVDYRINEREQKMLLHLNEHTWMDYLAVESYDKCQKKNQERMKNIHKLAEEYGKAIIEEENMTKEELELKNVGKKDPKRHLQEEMAPLLRENIVQSLAAMMDTASFQ